MANPDQNPDVPMESPQSGVYSPASEMVLEQLKDTSMSDPEHLPHSQHKETEGTSHKRSEAIKKGLKKEKVKKVLGCDEKDVTIQTGLERVKAKKILGCFEQDDGDHEKSPTPIEEEIQEGIQKAKVKRVLGYINEVNEDSMKIVQRSPLLSTLSSKREDRKKGYLVQGEVIRKFKPEDTSQDPRPLMTMRSSFVKLSLMILKLQPTSVVDAESLQAGSSMPSTPSIGKSSPLKSKSEERSPELSKSPGIEASNPSEKKDTSQKAHSVFHLLEGSYHIFFDTQNHIEREIESFNIEGVEVKYPSVLLFKKHIWVIGGSLYERGIPFVFNYPGEKNKNKNWRCMLCWKTCRTTAKPRCT